MVQNLMIFVSEVKVWSYILLFAELLNSIVFAPSVLPSFHTLEGDSVSFTQQNRWQSWKQETSSHP